MLAACNTTGNGDSLEADHMLVSTQMADLRVTGTIQAARLQITLDYAGTRVALGAAESGFIISTLEAYGTPRAALLEFQNNVGAGMIDLPTFTPRPASTPTTPVIGGNDNTDSFLPPTATSAPELATGTRLENVVLAASVGSDDCASEITSRFMTDTAEIYVVASAIDVSAGTTFTSRWLRGGEQMVSFDWTPDFDIDNACIWFFIDQSDVEFTPGTWSVALDIDGVPATSPVSFTIEAIN